MAELVKQAGASGSTLKNFLDTLAENNRLGLLNGVIEKFGQIVSAARGEVEMTVTSAQVRSITRSLEYRQSQRYHTVAKVHTLRRKLF